ncbi:type II secretion system secretin GspD [Nitratifractor salsuginis]|uniref:General secretion pathway protein D n=1 Tax=Nitratifractor salsuginis (strain DSM 16511 / JCM 12458 / E9I37-1) TaxID=749222 RepID=E6WY71_NITSE|nr:type II secretion system secretin GspD [Nitratifractor salsuginis]ADV45319.1 general secretion pathway protein D [Nitratifractor salsuginis DSM 16511]
MKFNKQLLITTLISFSLLWGQVETSNGGIKLNIRNMGVQQFVEMIGKITGKNILINGSLKGKINFIANHPIKKDSLFSLANSILASKGYALIDHGDFMEVVKASEAASMGLKVDKSVQGETMKTVLFPLKSSNAAVIRAKIRPLLGRNAKAVSFKENNVLAITAYPKTLKSIKMLIDSIETAGQKGSMVVKLKHAGVKDVYANAASMAKQLFPQTIPSEKVGVFKDEASNSIILVGNERNVKKMAEYIHQLDREGQSVTQKMYVIPLKNSNVEDMEKILGKLVAQMNNMSTKNAHRGKGAPQKAMVVADVERNALIVLATGEQYQNIMQVIHRIDVEKPQVFIKARVVEINSKKARAIGAKYGITGGWLTSHGLISVGGNMGGEAVNISQRLMSLVQQSDDNAFSLSDVKSLFALGINIDLLQQDGAAHVLSEPSILCTNNMESELFVGETRSILTSSTAGDNKNDLSRNNYEREDIGLTLKVKPRLSSNNKVALKVDAIIEDVDDSSGYNSPTPTTTKRTITTNATVRNGQTVILGGLIKNLTGAAHNKVPFFGDIPIIGRLFRDEGTAQRKVDLVIYLTPYVVRRSSDLTRLRHFLSNLESIQHRYSRFIRERMRHRGNTGYNQMFDKNAAQQQNMHPGSAVPHPQAGTGSQNPLSILNSRP